MPLSLRNKPPIRILSLPKIKHATFSMGRGEARVHVILQTNGNVADASGALPPADAPRWSRGLLAHARFALAARGFILDLEMRGGTMFLNPALSAALDCISERADDVRRAVYAGLRRAVRRRRQRRAPHRTSPLEPARGQRRRRSLFRHAQPTRRGPATPTMDLLRFAMAG